MELRTQSVAEVSETQSAQWGTGLVFRNAEVVLDPCAGEEGVRQECKQISLILSSGNRQTSKAVLFSWGFTLFYGIRVLKQSRSAQRTRNQLWEESGSEESAAWNKGRCSWFITCSRSLKCFIFCVMVSNLFMPQSFISTLQLWASQTPAMKTSVCEECWSRACMLQSLEIRMCHAEWREYAPYISPPPPPTPLPLCWIKH